MSGTSSRSISVRTSGPKSSSGRRCGRTSSRLPSTSSPRARAASRRATSWARSSIQQQDNPPGTPQRFLVIDGQQRLTTLQILVGAAARVAEKLGCVAEAELLRRLIYNNELLAKDDERFKVWPTNANQHAFRLVMDPNGAPVDAQDDPTNEIQEGHAFFAREIEAWVTDDGAGSAVASHFAALRVALSELLKLVSIRLEEGDNPQVIFETLNARGTPLIALDLLKNTVFLAADSEGADTEKLYYQHWAPELDLEYWRANRRQGRLFTKNGDLLPPVLADRRTGRTGAARQSCSGPSATAFFSRVSCPPMTELIPRLVRDARDPARARRRAAGRAQRGAFYRLLDLLDTTTMMPLALVLLRSPEISAERRAKALVSARELSGAADALRLDEQELQPPGSEPRRRDQQGPRPRRRSPGSAARGGDGAREPVADRRRRTRHHRDQAALRPSASRADSSWCSGRSSNACAARTRRPSRDSRSRRS